MRKMILDLRTTTRRNRLVSSVFHWFDGRRNFTRAPVHYEDSCGSRSFMRLVRSNNLSDPRSTRIVLPSFGTHHSFAIVVNNKMTTIKDYITTTTTTTMTLSVQDIITLSNIISWHGTRTNLRQDTGFISSIPGP
jgi:hypothetical protein